MTKKIVKKGVDVKILCGKDRGSKGVVLSVDREKQRVVVSGVNLCKRHMKPTKDRSGEIILKEMSIHISNVAVV